MIPSLRYDVVVIGGGAAGIAATAAAARNGAKVALLECHSFLGGKATAAFVGTICGLFLRNSNHQVNYASQGFAREFAEKLMYSANTKPQCNKEGLWYLPYQPFAFMKLCDNLIIEGKTDLFLHTVLSRVNRIENKIKSLHAISYDREVIFEADAIIDCSGEAMISKLAGYDVDECDEYQASAQVFYMENLLHAEPSLISLMMIREIKRAIDSAELETAYENISVVPGSHFNNQIAIKIGIPEKITNKLNKVTPVELLAREMIQTISVFLQRHVSPFKHAYVSSIAPEAGIRTGRRARGKQTITGKMVLNCEKFENGIAKGSWPIEQWGLGKRVNMQYFAEDNYYEIPAGCLMSGNCENLFFAGRHISADNEAIASARVIGTCLSTGYASGILASALAGGINLDQAIKNIRTEQVI